MKTDISKKLKLLACAIFLVFHGLFKTEAGQIQIYTAPNTLSNSFVFQMNGVVLTSYYSVSNYFAPPLDRSNITNLLQAYFVAQTPTNFDLYASLFESSNQPTNDGAIGAIPNAMWLKGVYQYGNRTLCDVRFRYTLNGAEQLHDTFLTMVQSNGLYFLTSDLEDPAVCLFEQARDDADVWSGTQLLATNWIGNGYFSMTNFAFGTNLSNPWIVWLPGSRLQSTLVFSNTPVVTNIFNSPKNVVITGIQSLISSNQNTYFELMLPDDLNRLSQYFNITPMDYIYTNWNESRKLVASGVRLSEQIIVGDIAYVTFYPLNTNGISGKKDWLYLRRFSDEWRLSFRYEDDANAAIYYLFDTCIQFQPNGLKVLPEL